MHLTPGWLKKEPFISEDFTDVTSYVQEPYVARMHPTPEKDSECIQEGATTSVGSGTERKVNRM